MNTEPQSSGTVIRSPNPGLRPFLEHESAIFFGRQSQIGEVIQRLRASRFVAVLGGSGSGKSSLIRAGVVPALRGYQIRDAGDFWIPVISVPGTNFARQETPIDRLARKFSLTLSPLDEHAASERRRLIADLLRAPSGLANIVEKYTKELDAPLGPKPESANFLFVLDQFEELFHPSNRDVRDCDLLVDRILDHFNSPHSRVFVVMTMRTEHLNDCAAYLHLPDAINKASYLIRRLDPSEIDEAIVKPAQRYLRMLARCATQRERLPEQTTVEKHVLNRLRFDVEALHADPDHLPLLQHLLAQVWVVASERVKASGLDVPDAITWEDLERAVAAVSSDKAPPEIDPDVNVLRTCLENNARRLFDGIGIDDRAGLDRLLVRLAFKDPNTGMYTQQRLGASEAAALLGNGRKIDEVRELLATFITPMDYLHWDDADPSNITIKVSHESFIRGWPHFRQLVDIEAETFEEYLALLRDVELWEETRNDANPQGLNGSLLDAFRLRRVHEIGLDHAMLRDDTKRWMLQLLSMKRDGDRWKNVSEYVPQFLELSRSENERRQKRRKRLLIAAPIIVLIAVLSGFMFSQNSLMKPATDRFNSVVKLLATSQPCSGTDNLCKRDQLSSLINASDVMLRDEQEATKKSGFILRTLYKLLDWPYRVNRGIDRMRTQAIEPQVNETLRMLLKSSLWETERPQKWGKKEEDDDKKNYVDIMDASRCPALGVGKLAVQSGHVEDTYRALFVPAGNELNDIHDPVSKDAVLALTVTKSAEGAIEQCLQPVPLALTRSPKDTIYAVDSSMRLLFVVPKQEATEYVDQSAQYVQMYEILWGANAIVDVSVESNFSAVRPIVVSSDETVVTAVNRIAAEERTNVITVPSMRVQGGRVIGFEKPGDDTGPYRRQFADSAHHLKIKGNPPDGWVTMSPREDEVDCAGAHLNTKGQESKEAAGSSARSISVVRPEEDNVVRTENAQFCAEIVQTLQVQNGTIGEELPTQVRVYRQTRDDTNNPIWVLTTTLDFGAVAPDANWITSTANAADPFDPEHKTMDGWIAVQHGKDPNSYWAGAPWSTRALADLARSVAPH